MASLGYTLEEVARSIGLSPARIRGCVRAGCIVPRRGKRGEYRFTFQDVTLLRTARGLLERLPATAVHRALRRLRRDLPADHALSGMRLTAEGGGVVARSAGVAWRPDSGQIVLDFDTVPARRNPSPVARQSVIAARRIAADLDADGWHAVGSDLEAVDASQARDAYRRALELDPLHFEARLDLGRLLHELGEVRAAEAQYRLALQARPDDATAAFNLGVALEDLRRPADAQREYEHAIALDAEYADAYFNLARLLERQGQRRGALRHLHAYRRLTQRG
jgi:tetratricopeptide (TPR) repeat protein